jgi:hypothetical protein
MSLPVWVSFREIGHCSHANDVAPGDGGIHNLATSNLPAAVRSSPTTTKKKIENDHCMLLMVKREKLGDALLLDGTKGNHGF